MILKVSVWPLNAEDVYLKTTEYFMSTTNGPRPGIILAPQGITIVEHKEICQAVFSKHNIDPTGSMAITFVVETDGTNV